MRGADVVYSPMREFVRSTTRRCQDHKGCASYLTFTLSSGTDALISVLCLPSLLPQAATSSAYPKRGAVLTGSFGSSSAYERPQISSQTPESPT